MVLYELLTGELPVGNFEPPSRKVQIDVRLDAIVLRALENTPELRYQTIGEMRTQVMTVVNEPGPARAGNSADMRHRARSTSPPVTSARRNSSPRSTVKCSFFAARPRWFSTTASSPSRGPGTTTVIPLAAIRDLSIGTYPRVMSPAGLDFISVTYEEGGQTNRLFFSPSEGWFGTPFHFNRFIAEWYQCHSRAIVTATGRAPGNTPANQLGTPSSSLAVLLVLVLVASLRASLRHAVQYWRFGPQDYPQVPPAPAAPRSVPLDVSPPQIPGKLRSGIKEVNPSHE